MGKNAIQVFQSDEFGEVRSVMRDGEPWFVAADVCSVLEITNPTQAVQRLDEDERAMLNIGRQGNSNIVNEFGLYSLVLGSRKPEAKKFKRWITHDVLPSIRKYGVYASSGIFENPDTLAAVLTALQREQERSERLQQRLNWVNSPKARKLRKADLARKPDDDLPERSVQMFLDTIQQLLDSGEARVLATADADADDDSDDLIGFIDSHYLYMRPEKTYAAVGKYCRAAGQSFPLSQRMLYRSLRQLGVIEFDRTTGTATKCKYLMGRSVRFLWIPLDKLNLTLSSNDARNAQIVE